MLYSLSLEDQDSTAGYGEHAVMIEHRTIDASYQITVDELLSAHSMATKVMNKRRPWLLRQKRGDRLVAGLMVVLMFLCLAFSLVFGIGTSGQHVLLGVFLVLTLIGFCLPWIFKGVMRRRFKNTPALGKTVHFSIDAEGVELRIEGLSESANKWPGYLRVARTAKGYLFFQNEQVYNWLPSRAFSSDRDADAAATLASMHAAEYLDLS